METDSTLIPPCFVRSLVAVASHKEDNCRRVCLEALRELAITNTAIVAHCDGIRVLFDAILDSACQDLAESLVLTVLFIMNDASTRQYIRLPIDLHILFAPFTETDIPAGTERRQRWAASRNAIVTMMRSWTGILMLASEPRGGLRSLVELLLSPVSEDVQKEILSTLCEIFYMHPPFEKRRTSSTSLEDSKNRTSLYTTQFKDKVLNQHQAIPPHNLLDNYTIVVLLACIHCGVLDALIQLGIGSNPTLGAPAIDLLREILRLSSRLLPEEHCAKLLALPTLVDVASMVESPSVGGIVMPDRHQSIRSAEMLTELAEAVNSVLKTTRHTPAYSNGVHMASDLLRGTNRPIQQVITGALLSSRERIVYELKASMDSQLDDATFKDLLYQRSRVLLGKDWFKWDWDVINELLEGPLTHPLRLSEAMKTKFFKRLSGFFRCDPGNKGYFAQLPWIPDYVPYLRPACQMYTLLLNHPEGLQFLKTDRRGQLLTEIADALELETRPEASIVDSHIGALQARMFSPEFCSRRMLREYFTLLGLMSSSAEGLRLLEQSNLFQRLYVMGKMQGHDFLCRLILANLDYSVDGSSRNLLQLWMTDGSKPLRLYATCLLRALLRSNVVDFANWGIDVLVTQLYQEDEVALAALSVLEEAAQTPQYLLAMILKRPQKLVALPAATNLLLRSLSLPEGLAFLREMDYIDQILEEWRSKHHVSYVHLVEDSLSRGLTRETERLNYQTTFSPLQSGPVPIPVIVPNSSHTNVKQHWGIEWLFRLPWNIEVRLVGPQGSGPPSNVKLDTFVDASEIGELHFDSDTIKVKGIVVDARNMPQPVVVNSQQTLQACLFLGTQPVDRRGFTKPPPQSNGGFILSYSRDIASDETNGTPSPRGDHGPDNASPSEEYKDWSNCRPEHRSNVSERNCSIYSPGECALWTFDPSNDKKSQRMFLKSVDFTLQLLPRKSLTVPMPPHLYGELAKTQFGCGILRNSGHISEFLHTIRDPGCVPLERRAALWALGLIAATSRGFDMIKKKSDEFVATVLQLAVSSPLLSLRGTCFYILGLISRSAPGRRALNAHGWESPSDSQATIAVPVDTTCLFNLPDYKYEGSTAECDLPTTDVPVEGGSLKSEWKDVLKLIGNLSSHITQKEAHATLNRLKSDKPHLFEEPELKLHVAKLLERYHFRLPARQFIHNMFDRAVLDNHAWKNFEETYDATPIPFRRRTSSASLPSNASSVQTVPRAIPSRVMSLGVHAKMTPSGSAIPSSTQAPGQVTSLYRGNRQPKYGRHTVFIGAPEAVV